LTASEACVLALIAAGYTNTAIADQRVLSLRTVEAHVRTIFVKLGLDPGDTSVNRRVAAALAWLEQDGQLEAA